MRHSMPPASWTERLAFHFEFVEHLTHGRRKHGGDAFDRPALVSVVARITQWKSYLLESKSRTADGSAFKSIKPQSRHTADITDTPSENLQNFTPSG